MSNFVVYLSCTSSVVHQGFAKTKQKQLGFPRNVMEELGGRERGIRHSAHEAPPNWEPCSTESHGCSSSSSFDSSLRAETTASRLLPYHLHHQPSLFSHRPTSCPPLISSLIFGLLPTSSNLSILLLIYSMSLLWTCPNHHQSGLAGFICKTLNMRWLFL